MTTSVTLGDRTALTTREFDAQHLNLWLDIELAWFGWGDDEPDTAKIARETDLMWTLHELNKLSEVPAKRRPSHKARSMTRKGKRYAVRKDHGTKVFYKAIEVENAGRQSWQQGSDRAWRKYSRLEAECGNPRIVNRAYRELIG